MAEDFPDAGLNSDPTLITAPVSSSESGNLDSIDHSSEGPSASTASESDLGAAALASEGLDQAKPEGSELVEDVSMAHEMAEAESPVRQAIENIRNSDMQDKDEVIKAMSENIDGLAAKAKERYIEAERNYKLARDYALTNIALAIQGETLPEAAQKFWAGNIVTFSDLTHMGAKVDTGEGGVASLDKERVNRLRQDIYSILGAELPETLNIQNVEYSPYRNYNFPIHGSLELPGAGFIEQNKLTGTTAMGQARDLSIIFNKP